MTTYNGYKNWTHWNVSLWLHNDEGLYRMMMDFLRICNTKYEAAEAILYNLHGHDLLETPDGAKYSVTAIRAALVGE